MSTRLARTADGWWLVTPAGLIRLGLPAATTAGLLGDRAALAAAVDAAQAAGPQEAVPAESLDVLSPVTAPTRIVAQAANPRYLHDGDVITATIATPDRQIDLGTQHTTVIGKTP
jgi:hypothetical protein